MVTNVGSDPVTLAGLLEGFAKQGGTKVNGTQLLEGMISDAYLPSYLGPDAAGNSWVQLFRKVQQQYLPKATFDGNTEYGMAQAYTFVQALQRAGQNPTRQSLLAALDAGGLTGPALAPFGYSATSHTGVTGVQIFRITGGVPVTDGPAYTTDAAAGPLVEVTATPATAPPNRIPSPGDPGRAAASAEDQPKRPEM